MCNPNSWCNSYSKHKKEKGFFKPTKLQLVRIFYFFYNFYLFLFLKIPYQLATLTNQIQNLNYDYRFVLFWVFVLIVLWFCIINRLILCCYHHMIWHVPLVTSHIMMIWLILNQMADYVGGPCSSIGWMMDDFC